jgi:hypothetical protein
VVRPVYFPRTNGHMEWSAPDGSTHEATFDDAPFRSDRTPSDQDFSGGARRNRTSDLSIISAAL